MRLRTLIGTRWPTKCACGCNAPIPCGGDVKVVVDFDTSRPRLSYLPEHAPDADTYRPRSEWSTAGAKSLPGFTPASAKAPEAPDAAPKAPPAAPEPPKAPAPSPLALMGSGAASDLPTNLRGSSSREIEDFAPTPSPQAGVAWATSQLTFNAGPYESAKSGFADYAQAGESPEQLRARVNRVVLEDIERQVRGLRELHERLGDVVKPFPSAARAAGASSGASAPSSPPRMITPPASPAVEEASPGLRPSAVGVGGGNTPPARDGPSVADLVARVNLELGDTSVRRKRAKDAAVRKLCELRGLASLRQASSADRAALEALVGIMDSINDWDLHAALGVPAPQLDERTIIPA